MTYLNGDRRRANILRFVRDYSLQHGYGPTETAIREHVGYRGHGLRSRHLDKMPGIYRAEDGRWMSTVEMRNYDIGIDEVEAMDPGTEKAIQLTVSALMEQEEHHKRWWLEGVLRALGVDPEEPKRQLDGLGYETWEPGIAP